MFGQDEEPTSAGQSLSSTGVQPPTHKSSPFVHSTHSAFPDTTSHSRSQISDFSNSPLALQSSSSLLVLHLSAPGVHVPMQPSVGSHTYLQALPVCQWLSVPQRSNAWPKHF